jgi:hypothetical protein
MLLSNSITEERIVEGLEMLLSLAPGAVQQIFRLEDAFWAGHRGDPAQTHGQDRVYNARS